MPNALEIAEKTYVGLGVNIHDEKNKELQESLEQLPDSCVAAAKELEKDREIYTAKGVFSDSIVDYMIKFLTAFDDANLRKDLGSDTAKILKLVNDNIHVG
jgi:glutamine synthetase